MGHDTKYSVASVRLAAEEGDLGEWVADFLASPGSDNAPLAEMLSNPARSWVGPVQLPLDQLHRLAGPPEHPVLEPTAEEEWRPGVDDMEHKIEDGWEPPPVIVSYRDEQLVLEDGNHRVESIRRTGRTTAWAVVGFEEPEDQDRFEELVAHGGGFARRSSK